MMAEKVDRVIWCYKIMQDELLQFHKECPKMILHEGFSPEVYEDLDARTHDLLIIDDMATGQETGGKIGVMS